MCLQAEVLAKAPKNDEELSEPDSPVKKPVAGKKGKKGAQPAKVCCPLRFMQHLPLYKQGDMFGMHNMGRC